MYNLQLSSLPSTTTALLALCTFHKRKEKRFRKIPSIAKIPIKIYQKYSSQCSAPIFARPLPLLIGRDLLSLRRDGFVVELGSVDAFPQAVGFAHGGLPQPQRAVLGAGSVQFAVGRETHAVYRTKVTFEGF